MEAQKIQAEIEELRARAAKELKEADGMDVGHAIALLDLQIAEKKQHHDSILNTIDMLHTLAGGKSGDGRPIDAGAGRILEGAVPSMAAAA